jgi:hypothetical protein
VVDGHVWHGFSSDGVEAIRMITSVSDSEPDPGIAPGSDPPWLAAQRRGMLVMTLIQLRWSPMPADSSSLTAARTQALEVRALYEILEERFNGKTWSLHELMIGFSNDVGYIGRLLLADEGTWGIDGDPRAELKHKLAESMWWTFVLADRLGIDMVEAYGDTMSRIRANLEGSIARAAT